MAGQWGADAGESETDGQFLAGLEPLRAGDDGETGHVEDLGRERRRVN